MLSIDYFLGTPDEAIASSDVPFTLLLLLRSVSSMWGMCGR